MFIPKNIILSKVIWSNKFDQASYNNTLKTANFSMI